MIFKMFLRRWLPVCMLIGVLAGPAAALAQEGSEETAPAARTEDEEAMRMFRRGEALLADRQDERAIKVLKGVLLNFPTSTVRFKAALRLGQYYADQDDYALGTKVLDPVVDAEDAAPEERAEALYRIGICQYGQSDFNRALSTLRRVTEEYPWSVYANEAYYYIGLCHFRKERWWKAVEALKLVGTSVPPNAKAQNFVESGQRFIVKVHDKDLRVLKVLDESFSVSVSVDSGDSESVEMKVFDDEGEYYLGSIKMELGDPMPDDGMLQVRGGDTIRVEYVDRNTLDGTPEITRLGVSRVVSTAIAGFMDGAYREYVNGVFSEQPTFVRVKDFDKDVSDQPDSVTVQLVSRYRVAEEEQEAQSVYDEEAPEYKERDHVDLVLTESGPHTGSFTATTVIQEGSEDGVADTSDAQLVALDGDDVSVEYLDEEHIGGLDDPREVEGHAQFVIGQIPDVWVAHREVSKENLRARKNLIEAQFYLRLAQIFGNVGLTDRSHVKADVGIEKVNDIILRSLRASIDQDMVEDAYHVKWELLLAKGDLGGAIRACRTLMSLYPQSSLTDVALLQIAKANIEAEDTQQALQILHGVLGIAASDEVKAEAQYLMGELMEGRVKKYARKEDRLKAMGAAVEAYKKCADDYPDSPFAGEALSKVIDFHLESKDYARCDEMLQMVFVDYPDAPFLDEMLLKWGVVLYRMKAYSQAADKLEELIRDYPNSGAAAKGQKILEIVRQRT